MKMRHQEQVREVSITILGFIAAAGLVSAIAVAPGIAVLLKTFGRKPAWRQHGEVNRTLKRFLRRGLISEVHRGRSVRYRLTAHGREFILRREFAHATLEKPKRWDGKWRLVVFDIPERSRHLRDHIRTHLIRLGLHPIQKSVWLFPYPCSDLVQLLRIDLCLGRTVQCFTVGAFEDREEERGWRLHFDV